MNLSLTFALNSRASSFLSGFCTGWSPKLMIAVNPGSEKRRKRCEPKLMSSHQQTKLLAGPSPAGVRELIEAYETGRSVSDANCKNEELNGKTSSPLVL